MKKIKTTDAVGHIISHDITEIVPGKFKGRAFKKGHIIREEDVEKLRSLGKDHIYIFELGKDELHENDAAVILGEIGCGKNVYLSDEIKEGKINFYASKDGLLKVDKEKLFEINMLGEISFATLPENIPVKKGDIIGGARVIPLVIDKKKMEAAKKLATDKIINVEEFQKMRVGIVTTGSEVYNNRISDKFGPVVREKLKEYDCEVTSQIIVPDEREKIKNAIKTHLEDSVDMIICTGGMSVDPDDLTPGSIIEMGGELVSYGSPVLPGSMFLLSYLENTVIMGLPGCVMYSKRTVFDLILPRVLAGEKIKKEDIMRYGSGGLCQNCDECRYPNCSFGK
ncbi:molybdopterin-binding protein [Ilyobacter polytropus]|uniref:Molybdopterin molybdenumtransferase n=1 Tax=Ilyobacter polytropus (strain ATCC 51220 / DSM 2926 / LMG 16218 / CuHBu1) TaxID=572544 RepID=E3H7I0_ILYPC|nr:molybdopterin-binding protein [Ilyobacter polytropus]ADO82876.1 molybdopterin binding domain protein [Ilyobacter polytropus DSM 2926]